MEPFWIIVGSGAILAGINFAIDRVMGVRKETTAIQKEVNDWNKEYMDAVKANDEPKLKKLKENEKEVMGKMTKMMFLPFKTAILVIPLYILFNWLLASNLDKTLKFTLPFPVPNFNFITWDNIVGVTGLFILSLIFFGLVLNILIPQVEKLFEKNKQVKAVN